MTDNGRWFSTDIVIAIAFICFAGVCNAVQTPGEWDIYDIGFGLNLVLASVSLLIGPVEDI